MCRKQCFTKQEAEKILKLKGKRRNQYRKEKRMYYCVGHNAWHLTSQDEHIELEEIPLQFGDVWKNLITETAY